jgi:hypothetical protein
MPTDDIPDNVDNRWLARHFLAFRDDLAGLKTEVRDIKSDLRHIREDLDMVAVRAIRIETSLTALRDDVRTLYELHGGLRRRLEALEPRQP